MGSYCRVVGGEGYRERTRQNLSGRGGITPAGRTEGALHEEACRMFLCFFFIALSKKGGFYSSGMAYAADRSQLLSKTQDVFASQSEGSILGLRLTSPAQPGREQTNTHHLFVESKQTAKRQKRTCVKAHVQCCYEWNFEE